MSFGYPPPGAKGGVGPNLRGLGGSVSGTGEFGFTAALKKAHITWSEQTLDRFLAAPSQEVPSTMMITSIDDPQKRADVVGLPAFREVIAAGFTRA